MLQLRIFIHQRLYAAAEEILGQVEKSLTSALRPAAIHQADAEVCAQRRRRTPDSLPTTAEASLTSSSVGHEDPGDAAPLLLLENPGASTPEETELKLSSEVSGDPGTDAEMDDDSSWSFAVTETDLKLSEIKVEQEELGTESHAVTLASVKEEEGRAEARGTGGREPFCPAAPGKRDEDWLGGGGEQSQAEGRGHETRRADLRPEGSAEGQKNRLFCHLCGKAFQYRGSLMKHVKSHGENTECAFCGNRCPSTAELVKHLKRLHAKKHFCEVCGQTFAKTRPLWLHMKAHAGGMKEFACQECGKVFSRKEHLVLHARTHSGEKPYHCDVCGKGFSQSQNLTIHKRSHSGERPYHCSVCGNRFSTSTHLKTHTRFHTGEKPYACDFCGKCFRQSGQMTRHRTIHTGERPYGCQICGKRFRFGPNLKAHHQTHVKADAKNY